MSIELRWFKPCVGIFMLQYRVRVCVRPASVSRKGVCGMPIAAIYEWSEWRNVPEVRECPEDDNYHRS